MYSTIVAYLLILLFVAIEGRLRQDDKARSLERSEADRGSTTAVGAAFGMDILAILLALVFNYFQIGRLAEGTVIGWIGVVVMLIGIMLRVWSAQVLGRFYTRTLLTTADQQLVEQGPYRWIRHPGYLGSLLLWIGAGLATGNWIAAVAITLITCAAYRYRIQTEEVMLRSSFGQSYADYTRHTWKLIPFLY